MNPIKNFDWKHCAAYALCIVILGAVHGVEALKPFADTILTVALPLFLYAGISTQQAGVFSGSAPALLGDKKGRIQLRARVIALGMFLTACSAAVTNAVWGDIKPAGACIANALATGGFSDPMLIVAECAGTTIEDVIAAIEVLLANQPDASALADGAVGAPGPSPHEVYLRQMLVKAKTAKAAQGH